MLDEKQAGVCGNFKLLLLGSATAETEWIKHRHSFPLLSLSRAVHTLVSLCEHGGVSLCSNIVVNTSQEVL